MSLYPFHHPDICPTVIRRCATDTLLDLIASGLQITTSRGKCLWGTWSSSESAYYSAVSRLRKKGLVAERGGEGRAPVFELTAEGRTRVSEVCSRREPWARKWNGIWYQIAYDVPEAERATREVLRAFLKRLRLGCLQKSVWVTPKDIRPDYADLVQASRIDLFSVLFECRTVLNRPAAEIVRMAWDMDRLRRGQEWYLQVCEENLARARAGTLSRNMLYALAGEELNAYVTVMKDDPLLPRPLWPAGYKGDEVWRFHRHFTAEWSKIA